MNFFRQLYYHLLYLTQPPWDSGISPPELYEFINSHPPGRAIDLGCGTGTNVITLASHGWQVTGVDFIPRAIRLAHHKLKASGLKADLYVDDVTRLENISGYFDFALDMGCFHGLKANKDAYLAKLDNILAQGGFWLMYGFYKSDPRRSGPGLIPADIDNISNHLPLVSRKDGFDKFKCPSTWFLFNKS